MIIGTAGLLTFLLFYVIVLSEPPPYAPQNEEVFFITFYSIALIGTLLITLCSFASICCFHFLSAFEFCVVVAILLSKGLRCHIPALLVAPVMVLILLPYCYYYLKRFSDKLNAEELH